jgi:phage repressor protein C with HTH and peptisase S24 domain
VARIREELKGSTHEILGKRLGVHKATISKWLGGTTKGADIKDFLRYMDVLSIMPSQLFEGVLPCEDDYGFIPKVYARLSAGGGSLETTGEIKGFYAFRKDFLKSMGTTNRNLVLMDVTGDSMEPTLFAGDTVLIATDEEDKKVKVGDLAAVRIDQEILIKRVNKEPGKIILISDNPKYKEVPVSLPIEDDSFAIIGKARWMARVLR